MSEWGNPYEQTSYILRFMRKKGTWGTETSQYPEEKKVVTIPRVAASEMGSAQTHLPNLGRKWNRRFVKIREQSLN